MNIKKFAVSPTSRLHLRNASDELMYADGADGQPDLTKPMAVILYGPGSKQYQTAQAANANKMVERLRRKGKVEQTAQERAAEQAEWLCSCTQGFENVEYGDLTGDAMARAIYTDPEIGFIADQVAKHVQDWGNFTKNSTGN